MEIYVRIKPLLSYFLLQCPDTMRALFAIALSPVIGGEGRGGEGLRSARFLHYNIVLDHYPAHAAKGAHLARHDEARDKTSDMDTKHTKLSNRVLTWRGSSGAIAAVSRAQRFSSPFRSVGTNILSNEWVESPRYI